MCHKQQGFPRVYHKHLRGGQKPLNWWIRGADLGVTTPKAGTGAAGTLVPIAGGRMSPGDLHLRRRVAEDPPGIWLGVNIQTTLPRSPRPWLCIPHCEGGHYRTILNFVFCPEHVACDVCAASPRPPPAGARGRFAFGNFSTCVPHAIVCVSDPRRGRAFSCLANLSNSERNRLMHALNGNTSAQTDIVSSTFHPRPGLLGGAPKRRGGIPAAASSWGASSCESIGALR